MADLDAQLEKERELTAVIDKTAARFREEFEDRLQKLREEMGDLIRSGIAAGPDGTAPALAAAVDTAGISSLLLSTAEAIDRTRSQTQVLAALLEGADALASRAAVLLTRPENIQGWGAVGFEERGKAIEETQLAYRSGTPWGEMAGARGMVSLSPGDAAIICRPLGAKSPKEAVLIPIALADRTAAVLYADNIGDDQTFDTAGLQLLATFAGLTLETLPLRRRGSTPSLRHAAEAGSEPGLPPWDPHGMTASGRSAAPTAKPASDAAGVLAGGGVQPTPAVADPVVERTEVEAAETAADAEPPPKPRTKRPSRKRRGASRSAADGEVAAPEDLSGPGTAFAAEKTTDPEEGRHEDAKRLARLLVSEIKLYNEAKVDEARQEKRLLKALASEIDQSRKVYNERIDESVRKQADYFHDELVRILAGGDQGALGN